MRVILILLMVYPVLLQGQIVITDGTTSPTFFTATDPTPANKDKITTIVISGGLDNQSTNTNLSNVSLILKGTGGTTNSTLTTTRPLDIHELTVEAGNNYDVIGNWTINSDLTLTKGNLIIDSDPTKLSKLIYTGSSEISTGKKDSYVNGPFFIRSSATSHTFPIGDDNGYAPVRLNNFDPPSDTNKELGFGITATDPGFALSGSIKEIFKDRYWRFSVSGGTFPSATISIGYDLQTESFKDSPSILELPEDTKTQKDLGGIDNNGFFSSILKTSGLSGYYALAKGDITRVSVHKLITPDDDGKNDVLYIDGIDAVPENRVTILDRWGVPFKKWDKSFVNYPQPATSNQSQDGIDFRSLAIGNYIVIVEYTELGKKKSIQQMISVLK
jgi:CHU_C Type IX secretion signal domain